MDTNADYTVAQAPTDEEPNPLTMNEVAAAPMLRSSLSPEEVFDLLIFYGWGESAQLVYDRQISGLLLLSLDTTTLMEVFTVLSLGSALQLLSLVQDSINNQRDTGLVESFKVLCPTGVAVWLKDI